MNGNFVCVFLSAAALVTASQRSSVEYVAPAIFEKLASTGRFRNIEGCLQATMTSIDESVGIEATSLPVAVIQELGSLPCIAERVETKHADAHLIYEWCHDRGFFVKEVDSESEDLLSQIVLGQADDSGWSVSDGALSRAYPDGHPCDSSGMRYATTVVIRCSLRSEHEVTSFEWAVSEFEAHCHVAVTLYLRSACAIPTDATDRIVCHL